MTDRGRVQQDVILGVLCGAMIGLFFDSIGKANPQEGLGLSALALLAGYNISSVFTFLDKLSNRLFQPPRLGARLRHGAATIRQWVVSPIVASAIDHCREIWKKARST